MPCTQIAGKILYRLSGINRYCSDLLEINTHKRGSDIPSDPLLLYSVNFHKKYPCLFCHCGFTITAESIRAVDSN